MRPVTLTVFTGYGPASSWVKRNASLLADALRELGIPVSVEEVRVPAVDFEEFEPFVLAGPGEEVHVPAVGVPVDRLVDYFVSVELPRIIGWPGLLPLPPASEAVEAG